MSFEFEKEQGKGSNRSAKITECLTCRGDRFVTVRTRMSRNPASVYEEVAACPDCHQIEVEFYRQGTSRFRMMDPATVRQAIAQ